MDNCSAVVKRNERWAVQSRINLNAVPAGRSMWGRNSARIRDYRCPSYGAKHPDVFSTDGANMKSAYLLCVCILVLGPLLSAQRLPATASGMGKEAGCEPIASR